MSSIQPRTKKRPAPAGLSRIQLAGAGDYLTVTVTSVRSERRPSFAIATSVYVPGAANRAVVTAFPFCTGVGLVSNVTLPGPRYSIQFTRSPTNPRPPPDEFRWARNRPSTPCGTAGSFGGGGGFGRPSSATEAVSVTGP